MSTVNLKYTLYKPSFASNGFRPWTFIVEKATWSIIIGIKTATFSQLSMIVHIRFRTFWYLKLCTSPKWKARVRFFEGGGEVCHRCRRRFCPRESLSQFQSNLVCSKKDCTLLQGGENKEKMKIHWRIPNFFFL